MSFDFETFIKELRKDKDPSKRKMIKEYEKHYGEINPLLKQNSFYKDYLKKFKVMDYCSPDDARFDKNLLLKLIAGSFSSEYDFVFINGCYFDEKPELNVTVYSSGMKLVKSISELWQFQIDNLFRIYLTELFSLQTIMFTDFEEACYVKSERERKIVIHNNKIEEARNFSNPSTIVISKHPDPLFLAVEEIINNHNISNSNN